ncbi:hypothetical protein [Roseinatronobacter monicus]|uniref:Uncharacterized protein n=1 Tax=Roseinatronobacter monicus TaxID=393481 RepID=A0A543KHJ9_9RHOB|nr:hypothetical protein [Roseinatronobacter monicus]TQM94550.1 hypothetical protein BD293_3231 [Roseinatronobacter monicus]
MTLQKRIDRLEGATAKPASGPCAIVREIMKPSATGSELVALMLRPLDGGGVVHIDRNPGEDETALRERFAAMCAT